MRDVLSIKITYNKIADSTFSKFKKETCTKKQQRSIFYSRIKVLYVFWREKRFAKVYRHLVTVNKVLT